MCYNIIWCKINFRSNIVNTGMRCQGGVIMLKRLIKHGNSRAIVVDKAILEVAGITEDTLFQISVNPSGGLVIQSVQDTKPDKFHEKFKELNKRYKKLMQNLADL